MALGVLSREAIERALAEYDDLGRDEFLEKYRFGRATAYALVVNGKEYDPKAIAGVAYGHDHPEHGPLVNTEFNGGLQLRSAFKPAGFDVVLMPSGSGSTIHDLLNEFLSNYLTARLHDTFSGQHSVQETLRQLAKAFQESDPVSMRPDVRVKPSAGQGNWAAAPWVAFLDRRETTSTQSGVYVVLLFREDMSGAYLTLAQGTQMLKQDGVAHMRNELRATAQRLQGSVPGELLSRGFKVGNDITLGSGSLARDYQESTIVHKFYPADQLPMDDEVIADLDEVLALSDGNIDRGLRENPGLRRQATESESLMPDSALIDLLEEHKNVVLEGVPGTGKTFAVEDLAARWQAATGRSLVSFGQQSFAAMVMHPSTTYEDFIEGLRPTTQTDSGDAPRYFDDPPPSGASMFAVDDGFFLRACRAAVSAPDQDVLVLLDEFNRCNVSSVMGDLLLTLEASKRAHFTGPDSGRPSARRWSAPVSVTLPYSGRRFFVPNNLYVVATTNTTDRSVAPIDAAIRRRFAFVRLEPQFNGLNSAASRLPSATSSLIKDSVDLLKSLNDHVLGPCLGPDALLGHSYVYGLVGRLRNTSNASRHPAIVANAWHFAILPQLIDGVRSYGAEDLLAPSSRDSWFADHGSEADATVAQSRSVLERLDSWLQQLGLEIVVQGTGLARGARVQPLQLKQALRIDIGQTTSIEVESIPDLGNDT